MSDEELWVSEVPKYGVVRTVVRDGDHAARFDDLNGDGREYCLTLFRREGAAWRPLADVDDSDHPGPDDSAIRGTWSGGVWAVGRAAPGSVVRVRIGSRTQAVEVDADGWWLRVTELEEIAQSTGSIPTSYPRHVAADGPS
ncbi:hypothetical protein [Nocardioides humi]|uniref:Agenet domain-containing protein n=1 Tax=Nocardioides humi TaxID=449461 RepID=A0ABN1ZS45_9ACTN|nr:hypothetical protein [Nocardioides humi]